MSTMALVEALALPAEARVEKRVPKKLLVEQGAPTAADRRQIHEGIEELIGIAALKPTTIGVPAYRDEIREYLEIAVLSLALRPNAKFVRLAELIHRAIPYPVVLVSDQAGLARMSMAHKRLARNERSAVVLDDVVVASPEIAVGIAASADTVAEFLKSLPLSRQPRVHLCAVYQGWIDCVVALMTAQVTGRFVLAVDPGAAADRRGSLLEYERTAKEIANLRARADKETQLNRRVEWNLHIRRLERELTARRARL